MLYLLTRLLLVLACALAPTAGAWAGARAGSEPVLQLSDDRESVDAWPVVTLLADPGQALSADEAWRRSRDFEPPQGPHANLGVRRDAVWLRVPVRAEGRARWVMEIDYPPLNRVDVYLRSGDRVTGPWRLGNDQPFEQRPVRSRAHALQLDLPAGQDAEVLLRVVTTSSMLVPVVFHRQDTYMPHESARQMLQGLLLGVALALLVYSLVNGVSLRDPLFAQYALMLLGVMLFFASYTGIGQQYLWSQQTGWLTKIAPQGVLLALLTGSLFVTRAMELHSRSPRVHRGLVTVAVLSALVLAASVLGLLDYRLTQAAATLLGPMPMLLAIPGALGMARQGDRVARTMLLGWSAYLVGAISMAGLLRGWLPADFWMQHLFQFASIGEMLAWVRVLSLRIESVQREAERVEAERHALHSLAYTDPLTGLPNRRGMNEALAHALAQCQTEQALAVYLLDLDGFKPVNDRLGHDVGDSLLVQVAQRLRGLVRHGDVVARLGGDEFVVMASGLRDDQDAQALGRKMLDAFRQPFIVAGHGCAVGLTIGYAMAPQDGRDAAELLRRADAAMYAGKQAGRHCLRRAVPGVGLVAA